MLRRKISVNSGVSVHSFYVAWGLCLLALVSWASAAVRENPLPVLFNDDGDFTFVGQNELEWQENLSNMLAPLPKLPVSGLVYALGTGTDVLLYPSKAGSSWGWRKTVIPERLGHIRNFPKAVQSGIDGVRWAADDAKTEGLTFIPAFRMNDAHYTSGTAPYLEGEFWLKNRERFTFGVPPYRVGKLSGYRELLDFSHPEVRAHRLAVIKEAIDRYTDVMDGFLLDFMRTPQFFVPETAVNQAPLMTGLVAEVRQALNEAEQKTGRKIPLLARVPPTLRNALKVGLDVKTWLQRGLVQVVLPSQSMTLAQDTNLEEFHEAGHGTEVQIFASIYERTSYTFEFGRQAPAAKDYAGRSATAALLRGAALALRAMGAEGFELYNFNLPLTESQQKGLSAFASRPESLRTKARTYAITPAYFVDYLDAFEPPKQIPAKLFPETTSRAFHLFVGEQEAWQSDPAYVGLRLGFAEAVFHGTIEITLNGHRLNSSDHAPSISYLNLPSAPKTYYQWALDQAARGTLKRGRNEIRIALVPSSSANAPPATLMEVQLGILPAVSVSEKSMEE